MYCSEISMRFSAGRSTPAMRAIPSSSSPGLALALLVAGVGGADDPHDALALHDLALVADLLHRRADLHDLVTRPKGSGTRRKAPPCLPAGPSGETCLPREHTRLLTHPDPCTGPMRRAPYNMRISGLQAFPAAIAPPV